MTHRCCCGVRAAALLLAALSGAGAARAQAAAAASAPPEPAQRIEIRSSRPGELEQRRQSTASKIVVGRDEIESFGDATLGEILKRLPGVTVQGAPGRGGAIRMRGLGGGYTQILLDGDRVPAGFSIDSLHPEQIERIEILRAPTAETGARAIAGTINIVTREGFAKRLNDLRLGLGFERGRVQPNVAWTRNDGSPGFAWNIATSAFAHNHHPSGTTTTTAEEPATGRVLSLQRESAFSSERRSGFNVSGRLQWLGAGGSQLMLMPVLFHAENANHRRYAMAADVGAARYASARNDSDGRFSMARLNLQWRHRLDDGTRLEWRGGIGSARGALRGAREEFDADAASLRLLDEDGRSRDTSATLALKASKLLDGDHALVGGLEAESARREEQRSALQDGSPLLASDGEAFRASNLRLAIYLQDEWKPAPRWAVHLGLRGESIATRGEDLDARATTNRSSVWTPLMHAVFRPQANGRDQLRISLTRSYRAPSLQSLIGRPSISGRSPLPGPNTPTTPDGAGNPDLRPEIARGIDIAFERYPSSGGLLSANLFHRRIADLMRSVTTLESVAWSDVPRWVARPRNIGDAVTSGIELEAKMRLSDLIDGAPAVDLRANASLFRSRVFGVAGPDNRLDQQPGGTLNLGADHRLRGGWPLTIGGNLNWTPGYRTRLSDTQWAEQGRKRVIDAYALWTLSPAMQLRLSAANLGALDHETLRRLEADALRESARSVSRSAPNWQLRLEMKL